MKKGILLTVLASAAAVTAVSCGPSTYALDVELRNPSDSGLDLAGKSISVVFLDNGESGDSLFAASMSTSFAERLEKEYFASDSLIGIYSLEKDDGRAYSGKEQMLELLMDTGTDVVFLFDSPKFGDISLSPLVSSGSSEPEGAYVAKGTFPYSVDLYAYDSMNNDDVVLDFHGNSIAESSAYVSGSESRDELVDILKENLADAAASAGRLSGSRFMNVWKRERAVFYIYESDSWYDSYYAVTGYRWQEAIDIWIGMLDTKNLQKKACIEYNIALACYLMGQYELADEWISLSSKDFSIPYASVLEKRIKARL